MRRKRIVRRKLVGSRPPEFPSHLHPVLARVLETRKVSSMDELDYSLAKLLSYAELLGIDEAVSILRRSLDEGERILIVGDFDADGATSCALMVRALRRMGAAEVDYLVPNRFEFGYGLSPEIVAVATGREPHLIVTVDNGITSVDGVRAAKEAGMLVVVTDHHLAAEELPQADAIVNPNQPEDRFPSKNLAGVGVAFYLMAALRARLREEDWFARKGLEGPNMAEFLDLVALGTVADVVPLDRNNRTLVSQGLARIRAGRCIEGVRALAEVSGRKLSRLAATDLGYALGPRLNAAGRLEDISLGIECLLCDDAGKALEMATRLDEINRERRTLEAEMRAQAEDLVEAMHLEDEGELPMGICLFDESWHEGVVGILASRIKEGYHRPVVGFAPASGGEQLKGSARSLPGLHIRDILEAIAGRNPGLITRFGGHAMAAGLTLPSGNFEKFSWAFDEEVRRRIGEEGLEGCLLSDGALAPDELSMGLAEALQTAGPWGQGFPEPFFDGEFELLERRAVGGGHLKMSLRHPNGRNRLEAIAFNCDDEEWPRGVDRVLLAYRLDINEYNGRRSLQLVVSYLEPLTSE